MSTRIQKAENKATESMNSLIFCKVRANPRLNYHEPYQNLGKVHDNLTLG